MKRVLLILFLAVQLHAGEWKTLRYAPQNAPADNPLKGFIPFSGMSKKDSFPHSMEWFYIKMSDLMNGPQSFTFDKSLEIKLNEIAARGKQSVFRIYLDYPGKEHGVPQFLIDQGLKMIPYKNDDHDNKGGVSPDYSDENLIKAIEDSINALGQKYDGDPRIGFITVGYLGHWGEWHTYPNHHLMADRKTQLRVIKAFHNSFRKTKFLLRYPDKGDNKYSCGFHDDSFAYTTLKEKGKSWHFLNQMEKSKQLSAWEIQPVGGEIYPPLQKNMWGEDPPKAAQDYFECVKESHCSWLINDAVFNGRLKSLDRKNAIKGAKALGYDFYISAYKFPKGQLHIKMTNKGVAPFYYNWPVYIIDSESGKTQKTNWDITGILPGQTATFKINCDWNRVSIKVPNPMKGGKEIKFANEDELITR